MVSRPIKVTNFKDSGPGSLRAALKQSQASEENSFDIIFDSTAKPDNQLKTGYFTIRLKSPLPNIYRNNVTINQTNPRSVILVADTAANTPQTSNGLMNRSSPGRVNGSMLVVGDANYIYPSKANYTGNSLPDVLINNVSFIRNEAKGGDGSNGAGGGMGTGGAITLIAGNLTIKDSIFQNLNAKGGSGGDPARGGNGAVFMDVFKQDDEKPGTSGGQGGLSSIPIRSEVDGTLAFDSDLAPNGGDGGAAGSGTNICAGKGNFSTHGGKNGTNGANATNMGMGGGGGGAGGGGAWSYDNYASCWIVPQIYFWPGGLGGRGGRPGTWGGYGGSGGKGGTAGGKNLFGAGTGPNAPSGGNKGQGGSDRGGAIAIWDRAARENSGLTARANLNLDRVSFYQNGSSGGQIWSDSNDSFIGINDVYFGEGRNSRRKVEPGQIVSNFVERKTSSYQTNKNLAPNFSGISIPRVASVADFSDTILVGTERADRFNVSFEDGSTVAGITSDFTDPNNPLNRIWKELVPDKEESILADYQAKANVSYVEAMFTTERLEDIGWNLLEDGIAASITGITAKFNPTGFGSATIASAVMDFMKDHIDYMKERVMLERNRDEALLENQKKQELMQKELSDDSTASLAVVDLAIERTRVRIKDFDLGEDIVTFPQSGDAGVQLNLSQRDGKTITFTYDSGSNADLPFLEVELTENSVSALRNANNASSQDVLASMLRKNDKIWILGSRIADPIEVTSTDASHGPGAATLIVNRLENSVPLEDQINLTTSRGSDQIFGTDGVENILSGRGDDMIFPGYGDDTVNGGKGSDLVSYAVRPMSESQPEPVSLVAVEPGIVHVKQLNNNQKSIGLLRNVENFYMYGPSDIDLNSIGPSSTGRYSVVSGAGGTLKGSSTDDSFSLSFYENWNDNVSDAYATTTTVDGGKGSDTLIIDTRNAPFDVVVKRSGDVMNILRASDQTSLVVATGIENLESITKRSQKSVPLDGVSEGGVVELSDDQDFGGLGSLQDVQGSKKDDLLIGSAANNAIYGQKGDDTMDGGVGDDVIFPGIGRNVSTGGKGNDRYQLAKKANDVVVVDSGDEVIVNFDPKGDTIVFANIEKMSISDSASLKTSKRAGYNVVINPSKNVIFYKNDEKSRFSTLGFENFDLSAMPRTHLLDSTALSMIEPSFV